MHTHHKAHCAHHRCCKILMMMCTHTDTCIHTDTCTLNAHTLAHAPDVLYTCGAAAVLVILVALYWSLTDRCLPLFYHKHTGGGPDDRVWPLFYYKLHSQWKYSCEYALCTCEQPVIVLMPRGSMQHIITVYIMMCTHTTRHTLCTPQMLQYI